MSLRTGKTSLASPPIDLAIDYERAILLNIDKINVDILGMDIHDGEGLLPISRSFGVCSLFKVH